MIDVSWRALLGLRPLAALALVLSVGVVFSWWSVRGADRMMREDLLRQARLVNQTVSPEWVKNLSGNTSDLETAQYARLKEHLRLTRLVDHRWEWLYLMGRRDDGTVFFHLDSEPDTDWDASLPGQVYGEATDLLQQVFTSGKAIVEGPVTDRWGIWVSALVPLLDPVDGSVLAVTGIDVEAGDWRRSAMRAGIFPAVMTLLLVAVLMTGFVLLHAPRERETELPRKTRLPLEAVLTVLVGLILTVTASWTLHRAEYRNHFKTFSLLAGVKSAQILESFASLSQNEIPGLASLLELNPVLTQEEFSVHSAYLHANTAVHSWMWLPAVRQSGRVESEIDSSGARFRPWLDAMNHSGCTLRGDPDGDLMMPVMDGHEALRRIRGIEKERRIEPGKEVRVIVVSSLEDQKNVCQAFFKGLASVYVTKPVNRESIQTALRSLNLE